MKLLIIGAGGHGRVVKDIAEQLHVYEQIDFIDDNLSTEAIGPIDSLHEYVKDYDHCIVGLGNNHLRSALTEKIIDLGYQVPILIHPRAYVASSARIGIGTVICANATVNCNSTIGRGVLISPNAVVDHNSRVEDYAHIDAGAVVNTDAVVSKGSKLDSCKVAHSGEVTTAVKTSLGTDPDEEWVRAYIKKFGEEPSFF